MENKYINRYHTFCRSLKKLEQLKNFRILFMFIMTYLKSLEMMQKNIINNIC